MMTCKRTRHGRECKKPLDHSGLCPWCDRDKLTEDAGDRPRSAGDEVCNKMRHGRLCKKPLDPDTGECPTCTSEAARVAADVKREREMEAAKSAG